MIDTIQYFIVLLALITAGFTMSWCAADFIIRDLTDHHLMLSTVRAFFLAIFFDLSIAVHVTHWGWS